MTKTKIFVSIILIKQVKLVKLIVSLLCVCVYTHFILIYIFQHSISNKIFIEYLYI